MHTQAIVWHSKQPLRKMLQACHTKKYTKTFQAMTAIRGGIHNVIRNIRKITSCYTMEIVCGNMFRKCAVSLTTKLLLEEHYNHMLNICMSDVVNSKY